MSDECDSGARAQRHGRLPALEGLRGLAALVVVVHHSLLATVPRFAGAYGVGPYPLRGTLEWWLTYSPLHVLWGGGEFVVVFFVLSGFVLSLPSARGGRAQRAVSYYPSRFVRLYLPVWGALIFAALVHALAIGRATRAIGADWWLRAFGEPLSLQAAREDAGLLSAHTGHWALLGVLWSLRWEVLFSLALPPLLAIAVHGLRTRVSWALVVAACAAALLWHGTSEYLLELPPFVLGMALAFGHADIARLARALARRRWWSAPARLLLAAACVGALSADWWLVRSAPEGQTAMSGTAALLVAAGACLMVLAALTLGSFETFLRSRAMAWTGRRSYSLYLVHCPIVVALALAAGGRFSPGYLLAALALSLAAAAAFHRVVEAPAHRFARRIAHATGGAADAEVVAAQLHPVVT
jgi:peptidoglycan/LPS O-acetylase OafA/YrhL